MLEKSLTGTMKGSLLIVSFTKTWQKTFRYFRVAFQGFSGSKGYWKVIYAVSFFISLFFTLQSFSVYVTRFVYLYLQKLESYPFDFRSLQQSINKRGLSGRCSLFPTAFNTGNRPLRIYIIRPYMLDHKENRLLFLHFTLPFATQIKMWPKMLHVWFPLIPGLCWFLY